MSKALKIALGVLAGIFLLCACAGVFTIVGTAGQVDDMPRTVLSSPSNRPAERPADAMTVAQEQAVRSAEGYLEFSGFSRSGLIAQMEFDGFSEEDASFAIDYLDPDWREQAARSAESYLDFQSFSRKGLIDQLKFEGYTTAQAEYGADEVGL